MKYYWECIQSNQIALNTVALLRSIPVPKKQKCTRTRAFVWPFFRKANHPSYLDLYIYALTNFAFWHPADISSRPKWGQICSFAKARWGDCHWWPHWILMQKNMNHLHWKIVKMLQNGRLRHAAFIMAGLYRNIFAQEMTPHAASKYHK